MRFLIQVVDDATVQILDKNTQNSIKRGLLIYVWISKYDLDDYTQKISRFTNKIWWLKVFADHDEHRIDLSLNDVNGSILLISNFTLYGNNKKGRQVDFSTSAKGAEAQNIYNYLVEQLQKAWYDLLTWEFGAMMKVSSTNDWPLNFWIEY